MLKEIEFTGDYKQQLEDILNEVEADLKLQPLEDRHVFIEGLLDKYVAHTGVKPANGALYRLTGIYLYDYLEGDTHADKITINEFPILSDGQLFRRETGIGWRRTVYGVTNREVPLEAAFDVGTDGNSYAPPTRYYRK